MYLVLLNLVNDLRDESTLFKVNEPSVNGIGVTIRHERQVGEVDAEVGNTGGIDLVQMLSIHLFAENGQKERRNSSSKYSQSSEADMDCAQSVGVPCN